MSDLKAVHFKRNAATADNRREFAGHRNQVMRLLRQAFAITQGKRVPGAPTSELSLCIFGAGNGNDLELPELLRLYRVLTLVDLDAQALDRAASQLDKLPKLQSQLTLQQDTDVSGILNGLSQYSSQEKVADDQFDALVETAANPPSMVEKFDGVASTCILSQIIDTTVMACGRAHPRLNELILAARDGHLRLLKKSLKPGGTAVLISDFISSDTLPELKTATQANFQELILGAINQGNFFTGTNPLSVQQQAEEIFGQTTEISDPWTWQLGERVFACFGIVVSTASPDESKNNVEIF